MHALSAVIMLSLTMWLSIHALASDDTAVKQREFILKHVGNYDAEALLNEPDIQKELQALLGQELARLYLNLNVRGQIDYVAGGLTITGNAPHQGGIEDALVCVDTYSRQVFAALRSGETITIYSRTREYAYLPLCIKDWITIENSGFKDRGEMPANVHVHTIE